MGAIENIEELSVDQLVAHVDRGELTHEDIIRLRKAKVDKRRQLVQQLKDARNSYDATGIKAPEGWYSMTSSLCTSLYQETRKLEALLKYAKQKKHKDNAKLSKLFTYFVQACHEMLGDDMFGKLIDRAEELKRERDDALN